MPVIRPRVWKSRRTSTRCPRLPVSPLLRSILDEFVPLATSIHTEKARSEFIIAPILAEVRQLMNHRISLFSGIDFEVDPVQGLNGTCDFVLASSRIQLFLRSPVLVIVEAKNEDMKQGMGQCAAEMVAARSSMNARRGSDDDPWRGHHGDGLAFPQTRREHAFRGQPEYPLEPVGRILSILLRCVGYDPATAGAAA